MGKIIVVLSDGFSSQKTKATRVEGEVKAARHFLVPESAYNSPLARGGCTRRVLKL